MSEVLSKYISILRVEVSSNFPAGMVSLVSMSTEGLDRPWNRLVGQLAKRYECTRCPYMWAVVTVVIFIWLL